MSENTSERTPVRRGYGKFVVVLMMVMTTIPATLTLMTVRVPRPLMMLSSPNPTPYGYTVSLLLFIVPIVAVAFCFLPQEGLRVPRRAFWWTIAILFPLGAGLDFFFARYFFKFPNSGATLRIPAPALGGSVPIEEYIFYLTGFIAVLLIYVWLSECWLSEYVPKNYHDQATATVRLVRFHWPSVVIGIALILAAFIYKNVFSEYQGVPGYFIFIILVSFIPTSFLYPVASQFINWRAFNITYFFMLMISLLWEATLGVPYQWWGYQRPAMMGIFIGAWSGLPVEAVMVWLALTSTTAVVYEIIKLWQEQGRRLRVSLFGPK